MRPDTVLSVEIWEWVWQTRILFFASSHCNSNRRGWTMGNKLKIFQIMVNSVKEVNKVMQYKLIGVPTSFGVGVRKSLDRGITFGLKSADWGTRIQNQGGKRVFRLEGKASTNVLSKKLHSRNKKGAVARIWVGGVGSKSCTW